MSEALDAIHDEALKLARRDDLTEELENGLNLILLYYNETLVLAFLPRILWAFNVRFRCERSAA